MLNFCEFIQVYVFTSNHHLKLYHIYERYLMLGYTCTRGYQKVLSLRHFPHSDSTMLHT